MKQRTKGNRDRYGAANKRTQRQNRYTKRKNTERVKKQRMKGNRQRQIKHSKRKETKIEKKQRNKENRKR